MLTAGILPDKLACPKQEQIDFGPMSCHIELQQSWRREKRHALGLLQRSFDIGMNFLRRLLFQCFA